MIKFKGKVIATGQNLTGKVDDEPKDGSLNIITSGAVYTAVNDLDEKYETITEPLEGQSIEHDENNVATNNFSGNIRVPGKVITNEIVNSNGQEWLQEKLTFDTTPTENSTNPVTSGGVFAVEQGIQEQLDGLSAAQNLDDIVGTYQDLLAYPTENLESGDKIKVLSDSGHDGAATYYEWNGTAWVYLGTDGEYYTKAQVDSLLSGKQNTLTFDSVPTQTSQNPVTSNGIYQAIADITLTMDSTLSTTSTNPVENQAVTNALNTKQDTLTAGHGIDINNNVISATNDTTVIFRTWEDD